MYRGRFTAYMQDAFINMNAPGKLSTSQILQARGRSWRNLQDEATISELVEHKDDQGRLHSLTGYAKTYTKTELYGEPQKFKEHYVEGCYHTEVDFALHTAEKVTQKLCLELLPKVTTKREYRAITRHLKKLGWNKKQRNRIPRLLDLTDLFKKKTKPTNSGIDFVYPSGGSIIIRSIKPSEGWASSWDHMTKFADQMSEIAKTFACPVITAEQKPKHIYFTKEIDPSECLKRFDKLAESQG